MSTSNLATIDVDLAISNAGGDLELAKELYRLLQNELPRYQREIHENYQQGDLEQLYQSVHKLNGSATYCGVPALKQAAHSFEQHLKAQKQVHFAEDHTRLQAEIATLLATPEMT